MRSLIEVRAREVKIKKSKLSFGKQLRTLRIYEWAQGQTLQSMNKPFIHALAPFQLPFTYLTVSIQLADTLIYNYPPLGRTVTTVDQKD